MATAGSVQAKIVGLITKANETTGNTDVDLTTAVDALVEGYGKGEETPTQEKTVNVTENGTTEVLPDAGFALSKVTVNTNVASGGGGEQPTLFAPFLEVKDTDELKYATYTVTGNDERNGGFVVSLSLRVNGEIVESPHTVTEVGTYIVEAIASAENFADGVTTRIVEVTELPQYSAGLTYSYTDTGIDGYRWGVANSNCTDVNVRIAPTYNDNPIEHIETMTIKQMESVEIPDSVIHITRHGFKECENLLRIDLPSGLKTIGVYAFYKCKKLEYVNIPKSVYSLSIMSFGFCENLQYVDFSDHESVPTMHSTDLFYECPDSLEIRVPSALYDEWISATNWVDAISKYKLRIVPV